MKIRHAWRRLLGVAVLACFGGVLGAACLELLLRGYFGCNGATEVVSIFQHDPRWGWRFRPGAQGIHSDLDFRVTYRINSKGLRDSEHGYEKSPGCRRILVLGDSFTEGYGVEAEQAYPSRLGEVLRAAGKNVEVINAGLRGTSTDQHLLYLLDEGLKYQPDLVLLSFVRGDENNTPVAGYMGARVYFKPYFRLAEQGLELAGTPVPQPDVSSIHNDKLEPLKKMLRPLALYRWLQVQVLAGDWRARLASAGILKKSSPTKAEQAQWAELVYGEEAWQVTAAILRAMKESTEAQGGQFAVFLAAGSTDYARQLDGLARAAGIAFLDVANTAQFHAGVAQGTLRLRHDGHWNARGHGEAAALLSPFVSRLLLEARAGSASLRANR